MGGMSAWAVGAVLSGSGSDPESSIPKSAIDSCQRFRTCWRYSSSVMDSGLAKKSKMAVQSDHTTWTAANQSSMPSWSMAASDMRLLSHGGSQTTSTCTAVTFINLANFAFTSPGSDPATGHAGDVSVMRRWMAPLG